MPELDDLSAGCVLFGLCLGGCLPALRCLEGSFVLWNWWCCWTCCGEPRGWLGWWRAGGCKTHCVGCHCCWCNGCGKIGGRWWSLVGCGVVLVSGEGRILRLLLWGSVGQWRRLLCSAGLDAGLVVWSDSASSSNASMSMSSRSREHWEKLSWLDGPEDMDTSSHSESWRVNSSVLPLMEDATEAPWCGNADVVLEMLGRAETTLWMGQLNFRS